MNGGPWWRRCTSSRLRAVVIKGLTQSYLGDGGLQARRSFFSALGERDPIDQRGGTVCAIMFISSVLN